MRIVSGLPNTASRLPDRAGRHDNRLEHIKELMDHLRAGLGIVDPQWIHVTDPIEVRSLTMLNDEY